MNDMFIFCQTSEDRRSTLCGYVLSQSKRMVTTELEKEQSRREVRHLVVLELATTVILGTAYDEKCIEGISLKTSLMTLSASGPMAIVVKTQRDHTVIVSAENTTETNRCMTNEYPCVATQVAKLCPMSETLVHVRTFCEGIQLAKSHENMVPERVALVAQDTVDFTSGISFLIKIANLLLPYTTVLKEMKAASCGAPPRTRFGCVSTEHKTNTASAARLHKDLQPEKEILDQHYSTKLQGAKLQVKNLRGTV